jgi:hypothetical protein
MPEPYSHPAAMDPEALAGQCQITRGRASGPGGQHRNKVETAVSILHKQSGQVGQASERRKQGENRKVALRRLRMNLALHVRQEIATPHKSSELWRSRCRGGKISVSTKHADFPGILAEALDVIVAQSYDPKPAATLLGCSMSQLVKLLKSEPSALAGVNEKRKEVGLRALR